MSIEKVIKELETIRVDYEESGWLNEVETIDTAIDIIKKVEEYKKEMDQMRNELCLKCGNYQREHLGACNVCRWRKEE